MAEQGAVQYDVFASGLLGVEPRTQLDHGRHPAPHAYPASGRREHPGDDLHEGALAGAVRAHDTHDLALVDMEAHAVHSAEEVVGDPAPGNPHHGLLQRVGAVVRDPVLEGQVFHSDGWLVAHMSTASEGHRRTKTRNPTANPTRPLTRM